MAWKAVLLAALLVAFHCSRAKGGKNATRKPNFVFIMTDDQDLLLNSLDHQPVVQEQFVRKGTFFKKHFCTVSICCPSRVSLLTGRAAHNTNVTDVKPPFGGYSKFIAEGLNERYLPIWLQGAGYNTYYTGKLMNGHSIRSYRSPSAAGWTRSDFLLDPGTYIYNNASMALDSGPAQFHPGKYSTDLIANRSAEFLRDAIAAGKPFFLGVTPIAPHTQTGPAGFDVPVPAERHKDLFPEAKVPRGINFNPDMPGSVSYLASLPKLNKKQLEYNDHFFRRRVQSLQAVDELITGLINILESRPDVLANTFLFYTSDNGFHIGQHRLPPGKTCNKEEDINIPFLARGPGIAAGKDAMVPTSHTDFVPTLFQLAGIPLLDDFDGQPIPLTEQSQASSQKAQEHVNVEFWGQHLFEGPMYRNQLKMTHSLARPESRDGDAAKEVPAADSTYKTLRVVGDGYDFSYSVWCTNEHELYDQIDDPAQMNNLYGATGFTSNFSIPELTARLDTLLLTLKSCKGATCRRPWQALFPACNVQSLREAMAPRYDKFFKEVQPKVSFSQCLYGYITAAEGALKSIPYSGSVFDCPPLASVGNGSIETEVCNSDDCSGSPAFSGS